ncbi:MAG: hypothetical protein FWC06_00215 [Treponema sp.]|nr:hypothetical protein [Treponema sp.]
MASNKKPSIYTDRSSIGSAEELDEYGVWVKSGPQILSDNNQLNASSGEPSVDFDDSFLSADDDDSLSVDDAVLDINSEDMADFDDMKFPDDNIEIDDENNTTSIDADIGGHSIQEIDNEEIDIKSLNIEDENIENLEDTSDDNETTESKDISLDTSADDIFDDNLEDVIDKSDNISMDIDDFDDEFEIDDITKNNVITEDDFDNGNNTDIDDIAKENIISGNNSVVSNDLSQIDTVDLDTFSAESFGIKSAENKSAEYRSDEQDIQKDDLIVSEDDTVVIYDDLLMDNTTSDDSDIPTVKSIENNVGIMQDNLNTAKIGGNELSSILLQQIASELSSIRNELTDLKKEFAIARSGIKAPEKPDNSAHSSFFSEEDDETISLTGDELNNILGTSGETIVEEGIPETIDDDNEGETIALTGGEIDNIISSGDLTEESGTEDIAEAESPVFEISIDEPTDEDIVIDEPLDKEISFDESPEEVELNLQEDAPLHEIDIDSLDIGTASDTSDIDTASEIEGVDLSMSDNINFADDEMSSIDMDDIVDETIDLEINEPSDAEVGEHLTGNDTDDSDILADEIPVESIIFDDAVLADKGDVIEEVPDEHIETDDMDIDFSTDLDEQTAEDILETGTGSSDDGDNEVKYDIDVTNAIDVDIHDSIDTDILDSIDSTLEDIDSVLDDIDTDAHGAVPQEDIPSLDDSNEELVMLREEGVEHLTAAPDNISYLEDNTIADDFDLSDAVIEEPDLSIDGINDDLSEPEIDESEYDLDTLDDITIDSEKIVEISIDDIPSEDDLTALKDEIESQVEDTYDIDNVEELLEEDSTELPQLDKDIEDISDEVISAPASKSVSDPQPAVKETPAVQDTPVKKASPYKKDHAPQTSPATKSAYSENGSFKIPVELKSELRNILSYMDQLLESLPEEKIEEFAKSDYFDSYKKLFKELGLV